MTTFCNLNCKDCADLLPWQKNCHYEYPLLLQDLKKVLKVINFIEEVLLIGGEVFLYPHLQEVVEYCLNENKIGKVIITTNGTILPSEELLELFKHPKMLVWVSGYKEDIVPKRINESTGAEKHQYS